MFKEIMDDEVPLHQNNELQHNVCTDFSVYFPQQKPENFLSDYTEQLSSNSDTHFVQQTPLSVLSLTSAFNLKISLIDVALTSFTEV